jgi:hypothetical protein
VAGLEVAAFVWAVEIGVEVAGFDVGVLLELELLEVAVLVGDEEVEVVIGSLEVEVLVG